MIGISQKGSNFSKTYAFLDKAMNPYYNFVNRAKIDQILQHGLNKLKDATPKGTGLTADSWSYEMKWVPVLGWWKIIFSNSNIQDGLRFSFERTPCRCPYVRSKFRYSN